MSATNLAFSIGVFLLAVGGSSIFVQYGIATPLGIEMAVWNIPIVPVAVVAMVVGALLTAWALRSKRRV